MAQLNAHVLSLITNNTLHFNEANNNKGSISSDSFESSFELLAAIELPNIEQYTYFYRKYTAPNLVMNIKIAHNRLSALLRTYDFFKYRLESIMSPTSFLLVLVLLSASAA